MNSTHDKKHKEKKFFSELFRLVILIFLFIAAYVWDMSERLKASLIGITHEQTIRHAPGRGASHNN